MRKFQKLKLAIQHQIFRLFQVATKKNMCIVQFMTEKMNKLSSLEIHYPQITINFMIKLHKKVFLYIQLILKENLCGASPLNKQMTCKI